MKFLFHSQRQDNSSNGIESTITLCGRKKELSKKAIENLKQEQEKLKEKVAKAAAMKLRAADRKHKEDCAEKKWKKR